MFPKILSKEWKSMKVAPRQSHNYNEWTLKKLCRVLKTYELEIQQNKEMKKGQRKEKTVVLVAEKEEEQEVASKVGAIRTTRNHY